MGTALHVGIAALGKKLYDNSKSNHGSKSASNQEDYGVGSETAKTVDIDSTDAATQDALASEAQKKKATASEWYTGAGGNAATLG